MQVMDKSMLWTAYLCASTAIFFADDIKRWVAARLKREPRPVAAPPPDPLEIAFEHLAVARAGPTDDAMNVLAKKPGTEITARLIELMTSGNAIVARRAAMVLIQRQDPIAMQALFRYFAR